MKKIQLLLILICISVIASANVNFSGNWKLNNEKSQLNEQFSMAPEKIVITHEGNDLKLERHSSFQGNPYVISDRFTLDGEECINDGWMDTKKKSTALWDDNKNKLTITTKFPMQDGSEMTIKEVVYVEGGCLFFENKTTSSYGVVEEKQVFDKEK
jgi:hypothetical protein